MRKPLENMEKTAKIAIIAIPFVFLHAILSETNIKLLGKWRIKKQLTSRMNTASIIGASVLILLLAFVSITPKVLGNHEIGDVDYTFRATPSSGPSPLTVTYTFTLTNNGNIPAEAEPKTPRQSNCSPVTFAGGDNNGNNELDPGERWTARCTTSVTQDSINRMSFSYSYCIDNHDGTLTCRNFDFVQLRASVDIITSLEVRAEPSTIEINRATQVTIYAADPRTHQPVAGQVITNEALTRFPRPVNIGNTNEPITHSFIPARGEPEFADIEVFGYHPVYPTITVVAPGYADTVVPIDFTGQLPLELLPPPPSFPHRPVPPDIEDGDDCPRPGRCPDERRDGPEPFDLP